MRIDVACGYEVLPVMHEPLVGLDLHQKQVPLSLATLIARGYSSIESRYIILDANRRTINEDDVLLYDDKTPRGSITDSIRSRSRHD